MLINSYYWFITHYFWIYLESLVAVQARMIRHSSSCYFCLWNCRTTNPNSDLKARLVCCALYTTLLCTFKYVASCWWKWYMIVCTVWFNSAFFRWLMYLLLLILDLVICLGCCLGLAKHSRWLLTVWVLFTLMHTYWRSADLHYCVCICTYCLVPQERFHAIFNHFFLFRLWTWYLNIYMAWWHVLILDLTESIKTQRGYTWY